MTATIVERAIGAGLAGNDWLIARRHPVPVGPLDPAAYDWTRPIEAAYPEIRAEVDALVADRVQLPTIRQVQGADQGNSGRWTTLVLYSYGHWLESATTRLPRTAELLRDVPDLMVAGLTVLGPAARLPRHRGPARGGLRYQVGIRVPGPAGSSGLVIGQTVHHWSEGASVLFDDLTEHEAWNDADDDRYVLFVEFAMPLTGVARVSNRLAQRLLGLGGRDIPARVALLDQVLNG